MAIVTEPPFTYSESEEKFVEIIREYKEDNPRFGLFICGGWVRDRLTGHPSKDIDAVGTDQVGFMSFMEEVSQKQGYRFETKVLFLTQGACRNQSLTQIKFEDLSIDFRELTWPIDLQMDTLTRDFTCNSIYFDPIANRIAHNEKFVQDLKDQYLRTVQPGSQIFKEDPGRYFRMARFAASRGLRLSDELSTALRTSRMNWTAYSWVKREFVKLFATESPVTAFELVYTFSMMRVFEGAQHNPQVYPPMLSLMAKVEAFRRLKDFEGFRMLGHNFHPKHLFANCHSVAHLQLNGGIKNCPFENTSLCSVCGRKDAKYISELVLAFRATPTDIPEKTIKYDRELACGFPAVVLLLGGCTESEIKQKSEKLGFLQTYCKRIFKEYLRTLGQFKGLEWLAAEHSRLAVLDYLPSFFEHADKENMREFLESAEERPIFPETESLKEAKLAALTLAEARYRGKNKLAAFWKFYLEQEGEMEWERPPNSTTFWGRFWEVLGTFDEREYPATLKKPGGMGN